VTTNLGSVEILPFLSDVTQLDSIYIYDKDSTPRQTSLFNHPKFAGQFSTWEIFEMNLKKTIACLRKHLELFTFFDQHQISTRCVTKMKADFFW
jgi:hypothetical protein